MTNDEADTRITRLETRLAATQSLLHCFLPAIDPTRRHLVLQQFGQWCCATEAKIHEDDVPQPFADWHLNELATMHRALEGALKLVGEWEKKKSS